MAYPRKSVDRAKYWLNLIKYSQQKSKPLFDACDVLVKQYFNEASTEREYSAGSGGGSGDEEHVRRIKAGIIYGWIDQTLSNMLDRDPILQCYPENKESAESSDPGDPNALSRAAVTSKINNYVYRTTKQLKVDEKVAFNAMVYPYGCVKIGYEEDFDREEQELLQTGVELGELDSAEDENLFLMQGQDVRVDGGHDHIRHISVHELLLKGELINMPDEEADFIGEVVGEHIEIHKKFHDRPGVSPNTAVQRDFPFAVNWPPGMFVTDVFCTEGPQDARWVAFGWELPIDEVKADPNLENTKDLEPSRWQDAPDIKDGEPDDGLGVVRGWEIWAKNAPVGRGKFRDILINVAEGHDKPLREEEEWPYDRLEDYPAETLTFQPGVRNWFHKPPLLMGGGDTVQALMNEVLDSFLSIIRKQKNLWLVDPATGIDNTVLQDLVDGPDGSIAVVKGLTEHAGKGIIPLPFHQVPPEKGELLSILQQIFDRSVGTPQPQQMPKVDTATEASILEKRNTARENRRSGLMSDFQIRKARKMWQLITQFRPSKLFLIDKQAPKFAQVTAEIARGEYLFTMDVSSHSTAVSVERSQWMDLLNLFAGLTPVMIQSFGMPPNLPEIARRLLVRGFSERVVEEILPMLEQAANTMQQGGGAPGQNGQVDEQGNPIPPEDAAQGAVVEGRQVGQGIGPLDRDSFQNATVNEGKQTGNAVTG